MSNAGTQDTIDLKAIFSKIIAKWWVFLITISLAVAAGAAYIKTTPKSYRVKSVLRMSEGRRSSFGQGKEEFLKGSGYLKSDAELEDEITMIRSVTNMTNTLNKLDFAIGYHATKNFLTKEIYDDPPFVVTMDSSDLQMTGISVHVKVDTVTRTMRVKAAGKNIALYDLRTNTISEQFDPKVEIDETVPLDQPYKGHPHLRFKVTVPPGRGMDPKADYFFFLNSIDELLRQWSGAVSVDPMSDESNIVILTTTGEVISKQKRFLDALMATYIESERDKNNKKGKATIEFIEQALGQSNKELTKAGDDLRAVQGGSGADVSGLQTEIFDLERQAMEAQALLAFLDNVEQTLNNDGTIAPADVQAPSLISSLEAYNRDKADLRQREATEVRPSQATLALRKRIQGTKEDIIGGAASLRSQTQSRLNSLRGQIATRRGQLYNVPGRTVQTEIYQNKFQLSQELNNYLMEKLYEAEIAVKSDQVDKTVVDASKPESPAPIAPDKKVVLGGAFLAGLLLPLLFILGLDLFNDKISDAEELKRLTKIPLLATIPTSKRKRVTPDEPKSLLAESFRTARINLQYLNADAARQVIGMTSSTSGEGKTFCAINLATVLAMSGKRTLLIDADMRRPKVQDYLELPDGAGLSTLLIGECGIDQAIRKSGTAGLDVITAGPIPPNPLELVESPRMAELFQAARSRYDQIVVDASPMGLVSEFKIIMGHVDVTLYVVRQGYTRRGMLRGVNELHTLGKLARVDVLLNDVKGKQGDGYGYYTA